MLLEQAICNFRRTIVASFASLRTKVLRLSSALAFPHGQDIADIRRRSAAWYSFARPPLGYLGAGTGCNVQVVQVVEDGTDRLARRRCEPWGAVARTIAA